MKWKDVEDEKYSFLYRNGYPVGRPMRSIKMFNIPKNLSCIDLGCGRGTLSSYFDNYTGVDISSYIIEHNKKNRKGNYIHASLDDLSIITDHYDIAICSDVMEHIPENHVESVLKSISKLSVDSYYFTISTRKSVILDRDKNNLHLTVWNSEDWRKIISKYFSISNEECLTSLYTIKCTQKK